MKFVQEIFPVPSRAEVIVEGVARVAALRLQVLLRRLDEPAALEGKASRMSALLKGVKDMVDMASVSYADTAVKKRVRVSAACVVFFYSCTLRIALHFGPLRKFK